MSDIGILQGDVAADATARPGHTDLETRRARAAGRICVVALLLGGVADGLLRVGGPPGLNMTLWIAIVATVLVTLLRQRQATLRGEQRFALAAALLFALLLVGRSSPPLILLSLASALSALALLAWTVRDPTGAVLRRGTPLDYGLAFIRTGVEGAFAPFQLTVTDGAFRHASRSPNARLAAAVARGALLAIPIVAVFGSLFMAADDAFSTLVTSVLHFDPEILGNHIALIVVGAWLSAGYLRGALLGREWDIARPADGWPAVGIVEIGIVLGALNALFLAFILVQLRYFFGGAAVVATTTGLTYADYARRGFFELVTACALVLPVLLVTEAALSRKQRSAVWVYRGLALALSLQLGVVMASAMHRMILYQQAYGQTVSRVYAGVFMGWIACVVAWFVISMLREATGGFALGAVVAGWAAIAALHVLNPESLVVRVNANRFRAGHEFDAAYAAELSEDAVPALLEVLPRLPAADRCPVARRIARLVGDTPPDWRVWNYSRSIARAEGSANAAVTEALASAACQPPPAPPQASPPPPAT